MSSHHIRSLLPGTFYQKPSPDARPYKAVGDVVAAGDVVGLIEVMKSFHEVHADAAGTIVEFLADNEDPVMAGEPLVLLDT